MDEPAGADPATVVALADDGVRFVSRSEAKRVVRGLERFHVDFMVRRVLPRP